MPRRLVARYSATRILASPGAFAAADIRLCLVPWLQRLGLLQLLQTKLRTAATDLPLSSHDLQRSPNSQACGVTAADQMGCA